MREIIKARKVLIIFILFVLMVILSWWVYSRKNYFSSKKQNLIKPTSNSLPSIDPSVKVDVVPLNLNREIKLTISHIPNGTHEIEYIISYETKDGGLQGVNSTAQIEGDGFEKKITLGTCSSGSCVYHQVKGKIRVELSFRGDYGEKYFTREYDLMK